MEHEKESYLTDEELEQLIAQVEQEPMLQAPSYLKDEILHSLSEQDEKMKQWQAKAKPYSRSQSRKQLWIYSAKVIMGTVAALIMLWVIPGNLVSFPGSTMIESPEQSVETIPLWEKQEPLSREEWEVRLEEQVPEPSALSGFLSDVNQLAGKICQGISDTANIFIE